MLIETLQPKDHAAWDAYVRARGDSTCYHLRGWQDVARRAYFIKAPFLVARSTAGGPLRGVLPLFSVKASIQSHLTTGLFGAYGTILGDDDVRRALGARAKAIFEEGGYKQLLIKCLGEQPGLEEMGLRRSDHWVIATLPLDPDPERVWKGFRDKIRNCVRKAQKHGLELHVGRAEVQHFYDVLFENMHQKGSPIYGLRFMRALLDAFPAEADILTLWHEGKPVSGAFLMHHGKTTSVPFAASLPSAHPMSPNNLLYWEIIKRACGRGSTTLDFGRSVLNTGPLAFKLGWGAKTVPQPTYMNAPPRPEEGFNPKDKRAELFVEQFKRLPRSVTRAVGPVLCSQLAGLL